MSAEIRTRRVFGDRGRCRLAGAVLTAAVLAAPSANGASGANAFQGTAPPETFDVGRRLVGFPHPESSSPTGNIFGSVWYPAESDGIGAAPARTGAPFPNLVFFHGHTTLSGSYVTLISDLVGRGYVVTAVETNSGIKTELADHAGFALDQERFVDHVEALAADPEDPFFGLLDPTAPLGTFGHSLGASALFFYTPAEPRVRAALALQPYVGPKYGGVRQGLEGARRYDGALFILSGTEDEVTPPFTQNKTYHDLARNASRVWFVVHGMAHLGPLESPPAQPQGSMPMAEQNAVHRAVATHFFEGALLRGDPLASFVEGDLCGAQLAHVERLPKPLDFALLDAGILVPGGEDALGEGPPLPPGVPLTGLRLRLDARGFWVERATLAPRP